MSAITGRIRANYFIELEQSLFVRIPLRWNPDHRRVRRLWLSGATGFGLSPGLSQIAARSLTTPALVEKSGPSEIRTRDLFNAIEARSQLRHGPIFCIQL